MYQTHAVPSARGLLMLPWIVINVDVPAMRTLTSKFVCLVAVLAVWVLLDQATPAGRAMRALPFAAPMFHSRPPSPTPTRAPSLKGLLRQFLPRDLACRGFRFEPGPGRFRLAVPGPPLLGFAAPGRDRARDGKNPCGAENYLPRERGRLSLQSRMALVKRRVPPSRKRTLPSQNTAIQPLSTSPFCLGPTDSHFPCLVRRFSAPLGVLCQVPPGGWESGRSDSPCNRSAPRPKVWDSWR